MPASIKIKRSTTTATPASLLEGEPAYSEVSDTLFIGANGGADVVAIGGPGTFLKTAQLLTEILAVDGPGSGINADLLDGFNTATGTTATTIPVRDGSGLLPGGITGNAATATKWATGRTVSLTGDATGTSGTLDGTGNVSISVTLANSGVTAATYPKVTVNSKGLVTGGASLIASDIPTLTASKISDFDTQVRTNRLDQMSAPQSDVGWNSRKITGLLDPTNAQDAATKAYVDATSTGLDVKDSVRVASTANINLSTGGLLTIDGIALAAGNRVLVKNQSTASQNGIYTAASGAWSRASDFDENAEVTAGAFMFVEQGSTYADTGWVLSTDNPITVGTTALSFVQFSSAGEVTAGAGLTKSGSTLDVGGTANRITVGADSVDIASTYVGQTSITTLGTITTGTWDGGTF